MVWLPNWLLDQSGKLDSGVESWIDDDIYNAWKFWIIEMTARRDFGGTTIALHFWEVHPPTDREL
jgi:hypothetical protein